jgi:hypothetical protein
VLPLEFEAYVDRYSEPPEWAGWYTGQGFRVAGARLFERSEEPVLWMKLSNDQNALAVVAVRNDDLYRVWRYRRVTDPSFAEPVWSEDAPPAPIDSEEAARSLARDMLSRHRRNDRLTRRGRPSDANPLLSPELQDGPLLWTRRPPESTK